MFESYRATDLTGGSDDEPSHRNPLCRLWRRPTSPPSAISTPTPGACARSRRPTTWSISRPTGSDEHHVVRLRRAANKRIDVIALAAETRADVDALHDKVVAAGCQIIFAPARSRRASAAAMASASSRPTACRSRFRATSRAARRASSRAGKAFRRRSATSSCIRPTTRRWRSSSSTCSASACRDWLGDFMVFLRCNTAHHRLALPARAALPQPCRLRHAERRRHDARRSSGCGRRAPTSAGGPGRHTAGNNTFSYFTTPNGFAVEYTSELEEVDFDTHEAHGPRARPAGHGPMGHRRRRPADHAASRSPMPACSSRRRPDAMALFEYFPNYIWNLSRRHRARKRRAIGEIVDMCQPIRDAAASGADAGTPQFMARMGRDGRQARRPRRRGRGAGTRFLGRRTS